MSLAKQTFGDREKSGETGSNSSNGGGSGNNSDNSALISLGNTSFGFNFDSEEGLNNSPNNSNNSEEGDSDGSNQMSGRKSKMQSTIQSSVEGETTSLVESQKQDLASSSSTPMDTGNPPLNLQNETDKIADALKPGIGRCHCCDLCSWIPSDGVLMHS